MNPVQAQVRNELRKEQEEQARAQKLAQVYSEKSELQLEGAPVLAVEGVFFRCGLLGDEVLPKAEMEERIKTFLYSQISEEPIMTSALLVYTLNKDAEKVNVCVETLGKYLDNVIKNPEEPKFAKIRVQNMAFQERVFSLEGSQEFLQAVGFELKELPGADGSPERFFVLRPDLARNTERLTTAKDVLFAAEPIRPELDRNRKVYYISGRMAPMEVPAEFYAISREELRREQQAINEAVERMGMLRTKEMREREQQRELRKYRYCLLRIMLPDSLLLQGTFRATEKLQAVFDFVRACLELDWLPFRLSRKGGDSLDEEASGGRSLAECQLAPATLLHFSCDTSVVDDVKRQRGSQKFSFLKQELLSTAEPL